MQASHTWSAKLLHGEISDANPETAWKGQVTLAIISDANLTHLECEMLHGEIPDAIYRNS